MATTTFPIAATMGTDNSLLRRIVFALYNNGATGMAPDAPNNVLLRQLLYALQNGAFSGGGSTVGHFDAAGNVQVFDAANNEWRSLTAPNGVITVGP